FTAPGAELRRFEGHQQAIADLAVLDSRRFLSCSHDKTIRLWDTQTGMELRRFEGHGEGVNSVAVIDARRVISASADKTVRLWDVETGAELRLLLRAKYLFVAAIVAGAGFAPSCRNARRTSTTAACLSSLTVRPRAMSGLSRSWCSSASISPFAISCGDSAGGNRCT